MEMFKYPVKTQNLITKLPRNFTKNIAQVSFTANYNYRMPSSSLYKEIITQVSWEQSISSGTTIKILVLQLISNKPMKTTMHPVSIAKYIAAYT